MPTLDQIKFISFYSFSLLVQQNKLNLFVKPPFCVSGLKGAVFEAVIPIYSLVQCSKHTLSENEAARETTQAVIQNSQRLVAIKGTSKISIIKS